MFRNYYKTLWGNWLVMAGCWFWWVLTWWVWPSASGPPPRSLPPPQNGCNWFAVLCCQSPPYTCKGVCGGRDYTQWCHRMDYKQAVERTLDIFKTKEQSEQTESNFQPTFKNQKRFSLLIEKNTRAIFSFRNLNQCISQCILKNYFDQFLRYQLVSVHQSTNQLIH